MPLIEPLEYAEEKRIKEFVIALDTSASCRGETLKNFLLKTYEILRKTESFFRKVNVHVIQCDAAVRSDTLITCPEDMDALIKEANFKGFGATDFRPVFEYVDGLISDRKLENLKGLIYFTDGYGIYPAKGPKYDVIFAFLREDKNRMPVPPWAMQTVFNEE